MRIVRFFMVLAIAGVSLGAGFAQTAASSHTATLTTQQMHQIDSFVVRAMARQRIPGLELGIYSRGRVLMAKGYGEADLELHVPVAPDTLFQSGSVGKQFVSAAIMMLVEEGKISLDDSITKYFPDAPATWKPIRIKNLLSHTSGLSEYETDARTAPGGPFYLRLDFTEAQLLRKIEAMPIEWAPGAKWAYRNTNYVLLGFVIHKVTGEPYEEFLKQRIFDPLGMASTRLISNRDIIYNRASGYEIDDSGQLKNQAWVSPTFNSTADGALYFTVLDLAKWDGALYGTRLLKQSSLDRIWTVYRLNDGKPNPDSYGFGWFIRTQNGHKLIEHGGAWQGFTCQIARYPDDNLTVVVLTNLDSGHSDPGAIAHVVAGLADSALLPAKLVAIADTQPAIKARLAQVLDQLAAGKDIRSQATPQLAAHITPDATKDAQQRLSKLWPGGTLTLVKRTLSSGTAKAATSMFRIKKNGNAALITFGLDRNGKVSRLGISPDREYE